MDAVELLKHDHRMVEQLLRDYEAARNDEQRRGVVEILIRELSKLPTSRRSSHWPRPSSPSMTVSVTAYRGGR